MILFLLVREQIRIILESNMPIHVNVRASNQHFFPSARPLVLTALLWLPGEKQHWLQQEVSAASRLRSDPGSLGLGWSWVATDLWFWRVVSARFGKYIVEGHSISEDHIENQRKISWYTPSANRSRLEVPLQHWGHARLVCSFPSANINSQTIAFSQEYTGVLSKERYMQHRRSTSSTGFVLCSKSWKCEQRPIVGTS